MLDPLKNKIQLFLFFLLFSFLISCSKSESVYINLVNMFPYLEKEYETTAIDFGIDDQSDEKYLVKGWGVPRSNNKKTFRWAVGTESTINVYLTSVTDKVAEMECLPFSPKDYSSPGGNVSKPYQIGNIYINDRYLDKINFVERRNYSLHIPSSILSYGSNSITFRWKYECREDLKEPGVRFCSLRFMDETQGFKINKSDNRISVSNDKVPMVMVPPGGMLEYYVDLPEKSFLNFGLFTNGKFYKDSKVHIAIYGDNEKRIIHEYISKDLNNRKEFKINLSSFAEETVKLVFSNSIENNPKFVISWINPIIYSTFRKKLPSFLEPEERKTLKKTAGEEEKEPGKNNVFIYLVDTLRADHLSCYGYKRKTTPFIDEFSKDGILFRNCFANASWTSPAVGSILTGLYPNKHRAENRKDKLSEKVAMLSEILQSNDYYNIHIATNPHITKEFNFIQSVDFYRANPIRNNSSEYVNSVFFRLIEKNPDLVKRPIFAYLHTMDPHYPYAPSDPFLKFKKKDKEREKLSLKKIILKKTQNKLTEEDIDFLVSLYDCEILQNDYHFGKFIDFLKEKKLYENSIIVFIADHGEQFDEHGGLKHGHSIYNEEIHVPLIIKFPNSELSGLRSKLFVSQVDILPTILDYLSVENSSETDGISLLSLLENPEFERTLFIKENLDEYNFVGFINSADKMKNIVRYKDKNYSHVINHEVYNMKEDFHELDDLYKEKSLFLTKSTKFKIDSILEKMERSALEREEEVDYKKLDPETIRALKALGYIK